MRHLLRFSFLGLQRRRLCSASHKNAENSAVRVRFAPSPTGFLHLGGLRTALYNYLFAKSKNGKFILRIEDTDQTRVVEGAMKQLQADLEWAGIIVDEGPNLKESPKGPYIQSERLSIYRDHVNVLLENGSAYHCFCTERRLELLRKEAIRLQQIPKYDNRCRNLSRVEVEEKLSQGEKSCIRFKLTPGYESFVDLVFGTMNNDLTLTEADPIIMKTDGYPTYHLANVVDDHCMEISHVLRGVEWQISTTKHILMYRAFGWTPPQFGHLPLLLNSDGSKLSKRQGDIKVDRYRESGILPLALLNYIINSGGGFHSHQHMKPEIYTLDQLAEQFDVHRINCHSGKLMPDRLLDFNRLELKRQLAHDDMKLVRDVEKVVRDSFPENLNNLQLDTKHVLDILHWSVNRINRISDLVSNDLRFLWVRPKSDVNVDKKILTSLGEFTKSLNDLTMEKGILTEFFKNFCTDHEIKYSAFMRTLRSLLSGLKEGPGVAEMMEILGKENTIKRIEFFINCNKPKSD